MVLIWYMATDTDPLDSEQKTSNDLNMINEFRIINLNIMADMQYRTHYSCQAHIDGLQV